MPAYPKKKEAKKRQRHGKSILQEKDGRCFLCRLAGDESVKIVEEHHIFGGPRRSISEAEGLKVYLCIPHHREGPEAVHGCKLTRELLQRIAQEKWEEKGSRERWMQLMGKNYR